MMKALVLALVFTAALCGMPRAIAQSSDPDPAMLYPTMHDINDARSLALGEGTAARPGDPELWNSNPANLAGVEGMGVAFGHVGDRDVQGNSVYLPGLWASTSLGVFAFHYSRYDLGTFQQTFDTGSTGVFFNAYEHTFSLSYGRHIVGPLSVGAGVKLLQSYLLPDGEIRAPLHPYFDLGAIGSFAGFGPDDSIHAGIAVQNLGGRYGWEGIDYSERVAQLGRAGITYDHVWHEDSKDPGMRISVNAEYRHVLNKGEFPQVGYGTGTPRVVHQVGLGGEFCYMNLFTLRAGLGIPTEMLRPDMQKVASFRYGGGLRLPLRDINLDVPLTLGVDYTMVSVPEYRPLDIPGTNRSVFNVRLAYAP